jgi:integrase
MPLTDTQIAKLRWQPNPATFYDRAGLQLTVYPRGVKTWQLRYMRAQTAEHGAVVFIPKTVTLGHWPEISCALARKRSTELRGKVKRGEEIGRQAVKVSLKTFSQRYLAHLVTLKKRKNLKPVERWIKRDILPALGSYAMHTITPDQAQKLVFAKRDAGHPAAAAAIRDLLDRIFKYGIICGVVEKNPIDRTPKNVVYAAKSRSRTLSVAEVRSFLTRIRDVRLGWKFRVMLELLLLTLTRKGELMLVQWKEIDFAAGIWEIPETKAKDGNPHNVYLSQRAMRLFRMLYPGTRRVDPEEYVLQSQGSRTQPMSATALNRAMTRIKWGMPHFTPHDLRRTASTILNEKGYNRDWIEIALGHTLGGIRGVYNRAQYADERKRMLQEWADFLEGLKNEA